MGVVDRIETLLKTQAKTAVAGGRAGQVLHVPVSTVEATFLRHAISVALRSPEFDADQRAALCEVSERCLALVDAELERRRLAQGGPVPPGLYQV